MDTRGLLSWSDVFIGGVLVNLVSALIPGGGGWTTTLGLLYAGTRLVLWVDAHRQGRLYMIVCSALLPVAVVSGTIAMTTTLTGSTRTDWGCVYAVAICGLVRLYPRSSPEATVRAVLRLIILVVVVPALASVAPPADRVSHVLAAGAVLAALTFLAAPWGRHFAISRSGLRWMALPGLGLVCLGATTAKDLGLELGVCVGAVGGCFVAIALLSAASRMLPCYLLLGVLSIAGPIAMARTDWALVGVPAIVGTIPLAFVLFCVAGALRWVHASTLGGIASGVAFSVSTPALLVAGQVPFALVTGTFALILGWLLWPGTRAGGRGFGDHLLRRIDGMMRTWLGAIGFLRVRVARAIAGTTSTGTGLRAHLA